MKNLSETYQHLDGLTIEALEAQQTETAKAERDATIAKLESEYSDLRLMVKEANAKAIESLSVANWRARMIAIQNQMTELLSQ